jgi:hypothetical protein
MVCGLSPGGDWIPREANARAPPLRNQNLADSPLEQAGFGLWSHPLIRRQTDGSDPPHLPTQQIYRFR